MPKLSDDDYKETVVPSMKDITGQEISGGVVDIMPYVKAIPKIDWGNHECWGDFVDKVFANNRYHHVLKCTKTINVYMVIVLRADVPLIKGHYLLDLNKEYGLTIEDKKSG